MNTVNKTLIHGGITTGVLILDHNLTLIDVNEPYLMMTGCNKDEILGTSIDKVDVDLAEKIAENKDDTAFGYFHSVIKNKRVKQLPVEVCFFSQYVETKKQTLLFIKKVSYENITQYNLSIIEQIFDHTNEAIIVTDNQGYIQTVNKSFSNITGYTQAEVAGKTPAILNSGKQNKTFYQQFWKKLVTEGCWQGEIWNKRKNGQIYPQWSNISSIKDNVGNISNYICQFSDITNRKKSEEELHYHTYHDVLTSLPNRHLLFEKLEYLTEHHNEKPTYFCVFFCDLDRFKFINDSLGHEVGDELLKSVAHRLNDRLRDNDIVARSGVDEFIIVIEGKK